MVFVLYNMQIVLKVSQNFYWAEVWDKQEFCLKANPLLLISYDAICYYIFRGIDLFSLKFEIKLKHFLVDFANKKVIWRL
jgi:hypothetical protein